MNILDEMKNRDKVPILFKLVLIVFLFDRLCRSAHRNSSVAVLDRPIHGRYRCAPGYGYFNLRNPTFNFFKFALNSLLSRLEALEVFKDKVFDL